MVGARERENMETTESKAAAEFTDLPVVTVHKRNIDKYQHKIVQDIQVNHKSLMLEAEPDTHRTYFRGAAL